MACLVSSLSLDFPSLSGCHVLFLLAMLCAPHDDLHAGPTLPPTQVLKAVEGMELKRSKDEATATQP